MLRFFDLALSILALVVLTPLLMVVVIVLRLTGEGEVFFLQERVGKYRKSFRLIKFATMLKDSSSIGTRTVTVKDDPRILPVGKFLRKTKINELPQLLNVVRGDMSLIGPRPQTLRCFDSYPPALQKTIVQVRPGLSGAGPIVFRNEEEILEGRGGMLDFYDSELSPYKAEVEAWFVRRQGFLVYFALILITLWVIAFPRSSLIWSVFEDLPRPPSTLTKQLNFPN